MSRTVSAGYVRPEVREQDLLSDPATNPTLRLNQLVAANPDLRSYIEQREARRKELTTVELMMKGVSGYSYLRPSEQIKIEEMLDYQFPASPDLKKVERAWSVKEYDPKTAAILPHATDANSVLAAGEGYLNAFRMVGEGFRGTMKWLMMPADMGAVSIGLEPPSDDADYYMKKMVEAVWPQPFVETEDPNRGIGRDWREPPSALSAYSIGGLVGSAHASLSVMLGAGRAGAMLGATSDTGAGFLAARTVGGKIGGMFLAAGAGTALEDEVRKFGAENGWNPTATEFYAKSAFVWGTGVTYAANMLGPEMHWLKGKKFAETAFRSGLTAGLQESIEETNEWAGHELFRTAFGVNEIVKWERTPFGGSFEFADNWAPYGQALQNLALSAGMGFLVGGTTFGMITKGEQRYIRRQFDKKQYRDLMDSTGESSFLQNALEYKVDGRFARDMTKLVGWFAENLAKDEGTDRETAWHKMFVRGHWQMQGGQTLGYANVEHVQNWVLGLAGKEVTGRWREVLGDGQVPANKALSFLQSEGHGYGLMWTGLKDDLQKMGSEPIDYAQFRTMARGRRHVFETTVDRWLSEDGKSDKDERLTSVVQRMTEVEKLLDGFEKKAELDPDLQGQKQELETELSILDKQRRALNTRVSGTNGVSVMVLKLDLNAKDPRTDESLRDVLVRLQRDQRSEAAAKRLLEFPAIRISMEDRQVLNQDGTTTPALSLMSVDHDLMQVLSTPLRDLTDKRKRAQNLSKRIAQAMVNTEIKVKYIARTLGLPDDLTGDNPAYALNNVSSDRQTGLNGRIRDIKKYLLMSEEVNPDIIDELDRLDDTFDGLFQLSHKLDGSLKVKETAEKEKERALVPDRLPLVDEVGTQVGVFREMAVTMLLQEAARRNYQYVVIQPELDAVARNRMMTRESVEGLLEYEAIRDQKDAEKDLGVDELKEEIGGALGLLDAPNSDMRPTFLAFEALGASDEEMDFLNTAGIIRSNLTDDVRSQIKTIRAFRKVVERLGGTLDNRGKLEEDRLPNPEHFLWLPVDGVWKLIGPGGEEVAAVAQEERPSASEGMRLARRYIADMQENPEKAQALVVPLTDDMRKRLLLGEQTFFASREVLTKEEKRLRSVYNEPGLPTDEELVARHRGGDQDALSELIRKYQYNEEKLRVKNGVKRILGAKNKQFAEDIMDEAWVKVLENFDTFDPEKGSFQAWFSTIAYNLARDVVARKREKDISADAPMGESEEGILSTIEGVINKPDKTVEEQETARNVKAVAGSLPEASRDIIALFHMADMTHAALARVLDLPLGTVKSRINTANRLFKEQFARLQEADIGPDDLPSTDLPALESDRSSYDRFIGGIKFGIVEGEYQEDPTGKSPVYGKISVGEKKILLRVNPANDTLEWAGRRLLARYAVRELRQRYPGYEIELSGDARRDAEGLLAPTRPAEGQTFFAKGEPQRRGIVRMAGSETSWFSIGHEGFDSGEATPGQEELWAILRGELIRVDVQTGKETHYDTIEEPYGVQQPSELPVKGRIDHAKKLISLSTEFSIDHLKRRTYLAQAKQAIQQLKKRYPSYDIVVFGTGDDELVPPEDRPIRSEWPATQKPLMKNIAAAYINQKGQGALVALEKEGQTPPVFLHEVAHILQLHLSLEQEAEIMEILQLGSDWTTEAREKFVNFFMAALAQRDTTIPPGIRDVVKRIRKALVGMYKMKLQGLERRNLSAQMRHWMEDLWLREYGSELAIVERKEEATEEEREAESRLIEVNKELADIDTPADTRTKDAKDAAKQALGVERDELLKQKAKWQRERNDAILSMAMNAPWTHQQQLERDLEQDEAYQTATDSSTKTKAGFWENQFVSGLWGALVNQSERLTSPAGKDLVRRARELHDRKLALDAGRFEELVELHGQPGRKARRWLGRLGEMEGMKGDEKRMVARQTNFALLMEGDKDTIDRMQKELDPGSLAEVMNYMNLVKLVQNYFGLRAMKLNMWRTLKSGDKVPFEETTRAFYFRFTTAPMREVMLRGGEMWNTFADAVANMNGVDRKVVDLWKDDLLKKGFEKSGMLEKTRGVKIIPDVIMQGEKVVLQVLHHDPLSYVNTLIRQSSLRTRIVEMFGSEAARSVKGEGDKRVAGHRVGFNRLLQAFGIPTRKALDLVVDELDDKVTGLTRDQLLALGGSKHKTDKQAFQQLMDAEGVTWQIGEEDGMQIVRNLGPREMRAKGIPEQVLNTRLRRIGKLIGGVNTKKGVDTWDLLREIKHRYEQKVEDFVIERFREAAKAQNEDMKVFEQMIDLIQGRPIAPIESNVWTRFGDLFDGIATNAMLSGSSPLNLAQLPLIGGMMGWAKLAGAMHRTIYDRVELRKQLQQFGAIRSLLRSRAHDLTYSTSKLARHLREVGGDIFLHSSINDTIDLVAGGMGLMWVEEFRQGVKTKHQKRMAKFFGLSDGDIAAINEKGMTREQEAQVITKAIQRANATKLGPTDQSLIELDSRLKLLRTLKSYAFNQFRNTLEVYRGVRAAIQDRDLAGILEASATLLMFAVGAIGSAAVWHLLSRARSGKHIITDGEDRLALAFTAITNVGVLGPIESAVNSFRYATGSGDATLNMLPTVNWVLDAFEYTIQVGADIIAKAGGDFPPLENRIMRGLPERVALSRFILSRIDRLVNEPRVSYGDTRTAVRNWERRQGKGSRVRVTRRGWASDWITDSFREALIDGDEERLLSLRKEFYTQMRQRNLNPVTEMQRVRQSLLASRPLDLTTENKVRFRRAVREDTWRVAVERDRQWVRMVNRVVPPTDR